jgi:diaminohydroxyphosphoribosylaminopyrimidine deaminase/5-amino-6-(5-phosphoribosylamino)uracil reductase
MASGSDLLFLRAALALAEKGRFIAPPNPSVGCLIVKEGAIVGRGWTHRPGEGHAEVNALAAAGDAARDATAYVSLEPCAFHGRTPPCSQALIDAGVRRVVAAMTDPHPQVAGQGFEDLRQASIAVDLIELPEAAEAIAGFVSRINRRRPFVRLKVAASLDGRTAMASGESKWVTGETARADVQAWRARSCAIVTGAETVLVDDPALTVRDQAFAVDGSLRQPLRVVLDSNLRVPESARLFSEPGETLVVHCAGGAPAHEQAEHLLLPAVDGRVDLNALLEQLAERPCNEVLIEAGPTLIGAFLKAGLWDELLLYIAPKLLGSDARPLAELPIARMLEAIEAKIAHRDLIGDDLRLRLVPA